MSPTLSPGRPRGGIDSRWAGLRPSRTSPWLAAGKLVRVEAVVWAYAAFTSDKLDLYYAADASAPAWTYIVALTPSAAGPQTLSATYTLPSGPLQAVRARFRYNGSASACGVGSYTTTTTSSSR